MSPSPQQAYDELIQIRRELATLGSCQALLYWDERTYMPRGGAEGRSKQVALLSGMIHERFTSPHIGELISAIEGTDVVSDGNSGKAAVMREIRREYDKAVKLPKDLVEELARVTSLAQGVWAEARQKSDFSIFLPKLKEVIDLKHRQAEAYGYETEPYDALIDDYEPYATVKTISEVFAKLREELVPLVKAIVDSGNRPNMSIIENDYPADLQEKFGHEAAAAIGFDFESGRLDVTTHPFCSGVAPGDCRITTRYNPRHLGQALFGILHEAGHGIYEQGLPQQHFGTPLAESVSLGIHESQSRMWENLVGRSKPFWEYFYPKARKTFPSLSGVAFEDFYFAVNNVQPSFIRVEADEVTYNLHILLRFEIERDLFAGKIKAEDLPSAWNEKFVEYFGLTPENDAIGCMQDIHWSAGLFGYFATYALGNLYASQFFAKAKEDMPDIEQKFAAGDFSGLKNWLRKNIHSHGQRYRAGELVQKVTGKPLNHEPMMTYLKSKFGKLYGI
ncbi:MAG: carboxypeptidase M32 [candidate division Zixibacteria bacterium]|nr:carboxypeptidase M32 [candidate division Zixibacteria bacterium]MBU1472002.1 carboxypeptidase M32 [candidate division Zixibacteria bacterium]MBU2626526.1 carboxypeptidase M32 [candidate division Zixibacteria bacterium]